jgi:hypothetical protein
VTGAVAAIASMAVLGNLLGSEPGRRRLGGDGLSLAELRLTTADPGVGLIERIFVLGVSAWIAALALLLLHDAAADPQAQRDARASG